MKSTTIFIFTLALVSFLISMPTVETWNKFTSCRGYRLRKGNINPSMIPSNRHEGEKVNLLELQTTESSDEDNPTFEGISNHLRSKNSNRKPKKVKLNVDVNINLGKH